MPTIKLISLHDSWRDPQSEFISYAEYDEEYQFTGKSWSCDIPRMDLFNLLIREGILKEEVRA